MIVAAVASVALSSLGPRVLGRATDIIFAGAIGKELPAGLDQGRGDRRRRHGAEDGSPTCCPASTWCRARGSTSRRWRTVLAASCWRCTSASALLSFLQGYLLNDVVQHTVRRMRAEVEEKLNRLPLRYFDGQPRGELLSRVTNDIDNVAQTLQQTMSQLLTSLLTIVFVVRDDVLDLVDAGADRPGDDPGSAWRSPGR